MHSAPRRLIEPTQMRLLVFLLVSMKHLRPTTIYSREIWILSGDQPSSQPSPGFTRISPLRPRLAPLCLPAVPETLAIFVGISRYQPHLSRTRSYRVSSLPHQHWSRPNSPFPPHRRRRARRDDVGLPPAYSSNGPASNVATPSAYSRTHISR